MAELIALILAFLASLGFGPGGGTRPPAPAPVPPSGGAGGNGTQVVPAAQIPTPALIPGLIGMGVAAMRKSKEQEQVEQAEAE